MARSESVSPPGEAEERQMKMRSRCPEGEIEFLFFTTHLASELNRYSDRSPGLVNSAKEPEKLMTMISNKNPAAGK
jgi:hypothetical protein